MAAEEPAGDEKDRERRRLERLLSAWVKRAVETGYEKLADGYERIAEGPENVRELMRDLKLPKELLAVLVSQVDETKTGLYRVVARELRDFLDHTNLAEELSRALTMLSFEVKMEVRFVPNDRGVVRPEVKPRVRVRRERSASEPPDEEEPVETDRGG
ncbi:MAG: hypothetical protein IT376_17080 [Polyangiaceae bacterium]|nr:hypothetical protein [Polyangiaceae bacterium]